MTETLLYEASVAAALQRHLAGGKREIKDS